MFAQSNLLNEALLTIERAEMLGGEHLATVLTSYALVAADCERFDVAVEKGRKAVELRPGHESRFALASVLTAAGYAAEAVTLHQQVLEEKPDHPLSGPNACFIQTLTDSTPEQLLAQRKRWYEVNRHRGPLEPHDNDRNPDRPLRVGYVGGDFKSHSAAFIFKNVVLHHGPEIELYLYSSLPTNAEQDHTTARFRATAGDRWREIEKLSDEDAAKLIRRDRIDILVDLAGHTGGNRLALFTRKPAPMQVTAWGFAHGTGLPEMDYFFADPIAVPVEEHCHYAEKIFDLPCIVTMEPPADYNLKATSIPPLKKNGYITFGSYARYEKMSDDCLRAFAEILRRVPDSRLQFKDAAMRRPYAIRRILSFMQDVDQERLSFSLPTAHHEHLLAYQQCDIALDPFPHGGGAVLLETLYMGVPVITRYGTQPAGRTGASVLTAIGRPEWVARNAAEYVEKAVEWAGRTKELAEARLTLRDQFVKSPVVAGYCGAVEAAYRSIWQEYCRK